MAIKCVLCERENPKVSDVVTDGSWLCKRCCRKSVLDGNHAKQIYEKDHVIMNELLTYVSFYFLNSSSDAIKNVLKNFYHPKEVSDAKVLLWQVATDRLPSLVIRQDSDLRSAKEADIVDIINAFRKMDSDDADFPDFVCKNMDRIPKYAPEEIDLASVVQRLSVVEDKLLNLHTVENKVAQVERSVTKNDDSVKTLFDLFYQSNSMAAKLKQSVNVSDSVIIEEKSGSPSGSATSTQQPRQSAVHSKESGKAKETQAQVSKASKAHREEVPVSSSKSPLKIIKFTRYTFYVFGYTEKRKECLLDKI